MTQTRWYSFDMPERELTEQERRDLMIDTVGSWALEGMQPNDLAIELGRRYIAGEITASEIVEIALERYRAE